MVGLMNKWLVELMAVVMAIAIAMAMCQHCS